MASVDPVKRDRLHILLDQIEMPDSFRSQHFANAEINKVVVHKGTKKWDFYFAIENALPIDVLSLFETRVQQKFMNIGIVSFHYTFSEQISEGPDLINYCRYAIAAMSVQFPMFQYLNQNSKVVLEDEILQIPMINEIQLTCFKSNASEAVLEQLKRFGIESITVVPFVIEEESKLDDFYAKREQEDRVSADQMIKALEEAPSSNGSDRSANEILAIGTDLRKFDIESISTIQDEERSKVIQGYVFQAETRELKTGRLLLTFKITDYTDSIAVKMFSRDKDDVGLLERVKKGIWVKVRGSVQNDTFARELVMIANDIVEVKGPERYDTFPEGEKRVELHTHTQMSQMDGIGTASQYIKEASKWGHEAIAITDHAVAQSFPEAYSAGKKHGIKIIYGLEANMVNDEVLIAYDERKRDLKTETYVVFDIETTGLSAVYDTIIEIAAVKIHDGNVIDTFESFANPHHRLSATTIELTGITDDMVSDAPNVDVVLKKFYEWTEDCILVAHNASFDTGFIKVGYAKYNIAPYNYSAIDTLELARALYPDMKNHRLNTLCKKFDIDLTQHHRAIYDAQATGHLFLKLLNDAFEAGVNDYSELNYSFNNQMSYKRSRPSHITILAKDHTGLKNLFKLISTSHIDYFHRVPRIPRSVLVKYREGLIIGSSCSNGELFEAAIQKNPEEVERIAKFYDFIEVQPPEVYEPLIEREVIRDMTAVKEVIKKLVLLGEKLEIPITATGNVHYVNEIDHIYRKILIGSQGGNPLNKVKQPLVHLRTTDEMMKCFSFLGEEKAREIVITNTQAVAAQIEEVKPIRDELYTPKIEGADEDIRNMSYKMARSIYGEELPELVEARLEKELKSIIGHGFAVIYLISHKLVKKSLDDGYLVGSRGSVGSSFVATMTEITEVNPLPPHYVCPKCKQSKFFDDGSVGSGYDLPDADCPDCGIKYRKDGQDIPFETFLGFKGDKVPDIDLNFSGEYQPRAHNYTKVLFGEEYVYRAGTIGTVADKTAYGYVKGYLENHNMHVRNAEIERLASGCVGAKRTSGQHPGGIIVVPDYMDIYDFTPIQYPADDTSAEWKTTHFDFHSIHDNLLKLDILGHDDPTVIRMLQDLSGIDPKTIPTDDPEVMKIFSGPESLGVTEEQIMCKTGTLGIPEFGTRFVRQMLEETKPSTFSELVQISGLSHGTDVWLNNANELIANGTCSLREVIGCRDDIMVYLIYQGLDPSLAFKIMESVRKGKGVPDEWKEDMKKNNVPDWYISSCEKIKYMFPKAHAAAYVLMAVRIAYFKVHHPILYYAAYFSVRADDFDVDIMYKGSNAIRAKMNEINQKGLDAAPKEKNLLTVLEIALEMCERGFSFQKLDLYKSHSKNFLVEGNTLVPPFRAIAGLGSAAAESVVIAREDGEFLSKEDLLKRTKLSKTILEFLEKHGCLGDMPDQNQLSLF